MRGPRVDYWTVPPVFTWFIARPVSCLLLSWFTKGFGSSHRGLLCLAGAQGMWEYKPSLAVSFKEPWVHPIFSCPRHFAPASCNRDISFWFATQRLGVEVRPRRRGAFASAPPGSSRKTSCSSRSPRPWCTTSGALSPPKACHKPPAELEPGGICGWTVVVGGLSNVGLVVFHVCLMTLHLLLVCGISFLLAERGFMLGWFPGQGPARFLMASHLPRRCKDRGRVPEPKPSRAGHGARCLGRPV